VTTFPLPLDLLVGTPGAVIDVIQGVVMALFILSAILLVIVVLLQEGKGGGIAGAFGGAGGETFGVKAGTVNRFTSYVGYAFLGLALLWAGLESKGAGGPASLTPPPVRTPEVSPPGGDAPPTPVEPPAPQDPPKDPPTDPPGGTPPEPAAPPAAPPAEPAAPPAAPPQPAAPPEQPAMGG
jgi:protein translocase SecG subunit